MADRTLTVTTGAGHRVGVVRHKPAYTHAQVPSSDPTKPDYDVVATADGARCTCKGYLFRSTCRHSTIVAGMTGQN